MDAYLPQTKHCSQVLCVHCKIDKGIRAKYTCLYFLGGGSQIYKQPKEGEDATVPNRYLCGEYGMPFAFNPDRTSAARDKYKAGNQF